MPQQADEVIDHRFKGLPPDAEGLTVGELAAERRSLFTGGFTTPVLTLSAGALEHNLRALAAFCTAHGLAFAPHGKTSMAPQLFHRQLEHGAWGITVAVPHQLRVAYAHGVKRIFLANELVDAAALRWLSARLAADPGLRVICYADSVEGVRLMDAALAGAPRPLDVVVELGGGPGARTGARTEDTCRAVADAVAASAVLRLAGVAGYEAEVPTGDEAGVRAWLTRLLALAEEFDEGGRFDGLDEIVVSAGGSAWFDAVADAFAGLPELSRPVLKLLRSGAYVSHDDVHYRRITPFNRIPAEGSLEPAFRIWTQVVSRPEPGQAFVNAGKRDMAYDLDLPVPLTVRAADGTVREAAGITVRKLSDQHAWLDVADGTELRVGEWVSLGMSHPCTIFEKWPLIPQVDADGTVTDYIRTYF
ncbi:D-threonine aldolase [Streptomyces sp. RB5]|uniref:D-threonine aldolase n=1 Tax=Streptomyces smaragdinus TaxID=2585196 RepID=A0A7K0CNH8_9ACTN|nr:amino acid deaminase [Streptomyces smaragdinus]MQY14833.1 D-threonine aldolase [Streptomyces smaragdinus]